MNPSNDYIIIGAGSAGCVLANKLSADPTNSVLLLEAGPMDRDLMIHIPAGVYRAYRDPRINWNYLTENEPNLFDRRVDMPRGKVVGGSSSINSMVYMRGHPLDYDRWADELGLTGWRYADCLPYFKAGEASDRGADMWRGDSGPLSVTKGSFDNPLYDAFLEAGVQSGQGCSDDLNGFQPEGLARFDATKKNGRRCSAAVAHLKPVLSRPNLTLVTRAMVQRIQFSGGQATGVEFEHKGVRHLIEAEKEVILCGGAINSPQTLMLSGIGPSDQLRNHGIDIVHHLPGVGQNLRDHASIVLQYACKRSFLIHRVGRPINKLLAGLRWMIDRNGIAASNIWEAGGLIRSNEDVLYPNIQYHFGPVGFSDVNGKLELLQAFAMHVDLLRPRSRGRIELKTSNPADKPAMYFNYFAEEADLDEMVEGVRRAREIISQPAFDPFRGEELAPGKSAQTDSEIKTAIRQMTITDYHPCGTCRMGNQEDAVVDAEFRIRGVKGLRVVDASVMPQIISANLNAPVQMMAARAADFILGKEQRVPIEARFAFHDKD